MVSISGLHDLDPLDLNLVHSFFMLCLVDWQVCTFPETVETGSPVDEELELLLDLVSDEFEDVLPEFLGVVRDFWLELDGVLVDPFDILLVKVDLEVVGE